MTRSHTRLHTPTSHPPLDETNVPPIRVHKPAVVDVAYADFVLCCYENHKSIMQVIRSTSSEIPSWHLERVVFPGQRLMFYAPLTAKLQIYNANMAGNLLSDTVPCDRLQVSEA
jgi:hypothetical protein